MLARSAGARDCSMVPGVPNRDFSLFPPAWLLSPSNVAPAGKLPAQSDVGLERVALLKWIS